MTPVITGTCIPRDKGKVIQGSLGLAFCLFQLQVSPPVTVPWAQAFVSQVVLLIAHPPVLQIVPGHSYIFGEAPWSAKGNLWQQGWQEQEKQYKLLKEACAYAETSVPVLKTEHPASQGSFSESHTAENSPQPTSMPGLGLSTERSVSVPSFLPCSSTSWQRAAVDQTITKLPADGQC